MGSMMMMMMMMIFDIRGQWSITLGFSECKILGCRIKFFQLSGSALVVLLQ
jgi:hypothetical protein